MLNVFMLSVVMLNVVGAKRITTDVSLRRIYEASYERLTIEIQIFSF